MHTFGIVTIFFVFTLVGVEFSVSTFFVPAASRLAHEAQKVLLLRLALILGKVMPIWYPVCALMLILETWVHWHTPGIYSLVAADGIWLLTLVLSIFFLVPLNNRVAEGAPDWQHAHRIGNERHRFRIGALAVAAILLANGLFA